MSDSDDTEVLLLIPPDFFLIETSREENDCSPANYYPCSPKDDSSREGCTIMSNQYDGPPARQSELDSINARLAQIEKNFSSASEISSVSNCTVKTRPNRRRNLLDKDKTSPSKFVHSTPKYPPTGYLPSSVDATPIDNKSILTEIDSFLRKTDAAASFKEPISMPVAIEKNVTSLRSDRLSDWAKPAAGGEALISLSEIWGNDGRMDNLSLHEERLRRQHCEKTIQALQTKLLEYQQKISVAITVDKSKDKVIETQKGENLKLKHQLRKLDEKSHSLEVDKKKYIARIQAENIELKARRDFLENELTQALTMTGRFQDKNEMLEEKMQCLTKSSSEIEAIYKKQLDDLELRVADSHRAEEIANEERNKAKMQLAKAQNDAEKASKENVDLKKQLELSQGEVEMVKQQKQNILEKFKEEKNRADLLGKQKSALQTELDKKDSQLIKELEAQRIALKSHYQQQLESVVSQKLKEFQSQLDSVEENLKSEAKQRERLIAERAIKQLEMINEKNEQEIHLRQAKHREEVELYRIQLANASTRIAELEDKLDSYKTRRADIAEKLHNVMETQWQKALEILTSPAQNTTETASTINPRNLDPDLLDGKPKPKERPENESFETPKSNRERKIHDRNKHVDRLQAYIEMLLNKSPRDLHNIEEFLKESKNSNSTGKSDPNQTKRDSNSKPPWK